MKRSFRSIDFKYTQQWNLHTERIWKQYYERWIYGGPSSAVDDDDDDDETVVVNHLCQKRPSQNLIYQQALQDLRIEPTQKATGWILTCTESQAVQGLNCHAFSRLMLVDGLRVGKEGGGRRGTRSIFTKYGNRRPNQSQTFGNCSCPKLIIPRNAPNNNVQLSHNAWNLAKKDSNAKSHWVVM
jgi:hypothetical protein